MVQVEIDGYNVRAIYDKYDILYNLLMGRRMETAGLSNVGHIWRDRHEVYSPVVVKADKIVRLNGHYDLGETEIVGSGSTVCGDRLTLYLDEDNNYIMWICGEKSGYSELFYDKNLSRELLMKNFRIISKIVCNTKIPLIPINTRKDPYEVMSNGWRLVKIDNGYYAIYPTYDMKYGIRFCNFIEKYGKMELSIDWDTYGLIVKYR